MMRAYVDFIKKCGVFFVSTVSDNAPESRPFGVISYDGRFLYLATAKGKKVYNEMRANPNIQITAILSGTREWVRISGLAFEENSFEKKIFMFTDNPRLANIYDSVHDPVFTIFRVEVTNLEKY